MIGLPYSREGDMALVCKNEEEMFLETGNLDRCYILQLEGEW